MMHALGKVGFHQSYTYFTWRTGKDELTEYLTELSGEPADYMRPNFWPTPPTSCTSSSSTAGRRRSRSGPCWPPRCLRPGGCTPGTSCASTSRSARAARSTWTARSTSSGRATSPASSPTGRSLEPLLTRLNGIRREHPALRELRTEHDSTRIDNDALLAYSKRDPATGDTVLIVVTLNPFSPEEGTLWLDMGALAMQDYDRFWVRDEVTGEEYQWGQSNYVRLEPARAVAHILNMPTHPARSAGRPAAPGVTVESELTK